MNELFFDEIVKHIKDKNLTRINICGSPGSGKSTLSIKLSKLLKYNLIDLDDFFYNENCNRKSKDQDIFELEHILSEDKIIIDGTYSSTLKYRVDKVDLFIFTKRKVLRNLYRFIKRLIKAKKIKCGERITLKTLTLILNYKKVESDIFNLIIPTEKLIIYKGI